MMVRAKIRLAGLKRFFYLTLTLTIPKLLSLGYLVRIPNYVPLAMLAANWTC